MYELLKREVGGQLIRSVRYPFGEKVEYTYVRIDVLTSVTQSLRTKKTIPKKGKGDTLLVDWHVHPNLPENYTVSDEDKKYRDILSNSDQKDAKCYIIIDKFDTNSDETTKNFDIITY